MVAKYPGTQSGFFAKAYVNFIYIPSGLLLLGCAITKPAWLPYAAALALTLGSWQFYDMQPRPVLKPSQFQEFELQEKTIVSHNVAVSVSTVPENGLIDPDLENSYRFRLPSSKSVLGLPIGQHVSAAVHFPGQKYQTQRSYTPITSDEENRGYFDLLVKSYPNGNLSKHLASLQIGQTLRFQGPKGAMVYSPNMCRRIGMIAGGTGITPMLQIIKAIVRGRPRNGGRDVTDVNLIFANVKQEDILLKEDLDALAAEDDRFDVQYVLNNPPEGWDGGVGFVTQDMIKTHLPPPASDIKILVCGPPPMVDAMRAATEAAGYEKPQQRTAKLHDQVFYF